MGRVLWGVPSGSVHHLFGLALTVGEEGTRVKEALGVDVLNILLRVLRAAGSRRWEEETNDHGFFCLFVWTEK